MHLFRHVSCFFLTATSFIGPPTATAQQDEQSRKQEAIVTEVDSTWNQVFDFEKGWTGGDGAGTVDLGNGRVLWMFADSLIGDVVDDKHAAGTHMINNVMAIQTLSEDGVPNRRQFEFAWGANDENQKPTAWLIPDPDLVKPSSPIVSAKYPNSWYWPAGGGCTFDENGKRKLVFFQYHVGRTDKDQGVWSFKIIGGAMTVIDDTDRPLSEWKPRQLDLPHSVDSDLLATRSTEGDGHLKAKNLNEFHWGMACLIHESELAGTKTEFVYIYGARPQEMLHRQVVLARVPASQIEDFSTWRFFAGGQNWTDDVFLAKPITDSGAGEFSVERITWQGTTKYVMIHSEDMLGTRVFARTADLPEGPWSPQRQIYDVPDVLRSKNYFTYAAKGHASISLDGMLLISYIVNSQDFWEMLGDASIYRPRFVSISLEELFEPRSVD
ncbi:MAG: DUF4185 domain-containing protein [Pirellulaceae bacterium]